MIDSFSLFVTHSLMLLAAWKFLKMAGRDPEEVHRSVSEQGWGKKR